MPSQNETLYCYFMSVNNNDWWLCPYYDASHSLSIPAVYTNNFPLGTYNPSANAAATLSPPTGAYTYLPGYYLPTGDYAYGSSLFLPQYWNNFVGNVLQNWNWTDFALYQLVVSTLHSFLKTSCTKKAYPLNVLNPFSPKRSFQFRAAHFRSYFFYPITSPTQENGAVLWLCILWNIGCLFYAFFEVCDILLNRPSSSSYLRSSGSTIGRCLNRTPQNYRLHWTNNLTGKSLVKWSNQMNLSLLVAISWIVVFFGNFGSSC